MAETPDLAPQLFKTRSAVCFADTEKTWLRVLPESSSDGGVTILLGDDRHTLRIHLSRLMAVRAVRDLVPLLAPLSPDDFLNRRDAN